MPIICTKCKSNKVSEAVKGGKLTHECHDCGQLTHEEFVVDDRIKRITTGQGTVHIIAVAIVHHNEKLLFVEQDAYPHALELPNSHLRKDETLEHTLTRTVEELLGLEVKASTLIHQTELPTINCRFGADTEEWAIFDVALNDTELVTSNPSRPIIWVPTSELNSRHLTAESLFALEAIGYIRPE